MANLIQQAIAAFSSLVVLLIAWTTFSPIIDGVLSGLVAESLLGFSGTSLATNVSALALTSTLIVIFFKVFVWFLVFAVFVRLFVYVGFLESEQTTGGY
jgi:hypothetical protein